MRCVYCEGPVVGHEDVMVVSGLGPSHKRCYEQEQHKEDWVEFEGIVLESWDNERLLELKERVLIELNSRFYKTQAIELF